MAVSDRHRVVVGLVAHQRLRRDAPGRLIAGIKRCRRERAHRGEVALQSLADRFAFAAQDIELAPLALLLQPEVERVPGREFRHRHHEVATTIAHQAFDIAFVVTLARAAIPIPDQVMRQETAEQRSTLAGAVWQDLRHQTAVVVIDDRLRNRLEEGEGVDVTVNPGFGQPDRQEISLPDAEQSRLYRRGGPQGRATPASMTPSSTPGCGTRSTPS